MKLSVVKLLLWSLLCFCLLPAISVAAEPIESLEADILILNSYSRGFPWTDEQTKGMLDTFQGSGLNPDIYIEYLDWKNNPNPEDLTLLHDLFKEKYALKPFSLIMTTDDAALSFALRYREELFHNAPVVFSGVFPKAAQTMLKNQKNVTGVYEILNIPETLKLMTSINPNVKNIILISDQTESGVQSKQIAMPIIDHTPGLSVEDCSDLDANDLISKLSQLPSDSAVLLMTYATDSSGRQKKMNDYVHLFSSASSVPLYVLYDFEMGSGALGGSLLNGRLQGEQAAKLGIQILNGETADTISPVADLATTVAQVDYDQLVRYQLSLYNVPSEAKIINHPLEFYQNHKGAVWTVIMSFALLIFYVLILLENIRRRKRIERDLKHKNEELGALYEEIYASQDELSAKYDELSASQVALSKSEERYQLAMAGSNDGLWDWDITEDHLFLSDHCGKILGMKLRQSYQSEEFLQQIGITQSKLFFVQKINQYVHCGQLYFQTEYFLGESFGSRWILIRGKILLNQAHEAVRLTGSLTDITSRKKNEAAVQYLAFYDSLTGLANRSALTKRLSETLTRRTPEQEGAVVFVDIDNFKTINDLLGHSFGDQLLIAIGKLLGKIANQAFIARMGGDEFVLFFDSIHSKTTMDHYAKMLVDSLNEPIIIAGKTCNISVSVGITRYPEDGVTADKLLKNADIAMYKAKNQGKNQYVFFDQSLEAAVEGRALMERNLRKALNQKEIVLWYQPIFDVQSGKLNRFEALARWPSKEYGMVPPDQFIPLAEETGLIFPLGKELLRQACEFIGKLEKQGHQDMLVTFNVSAAQLMQKDFVNWVQESIRSSEIRPSSLGIEITESILMESLEESIAKLEMLKQQGLSIYLDDFGTGYSSLKYLKYLPIDVVKIDKTFISGMLTNQKDRDFTKVIIELAHLLNKKTVAEGVETKDQLTVLIENQCDAAQGYFFSKPLPPTEAFEVLEP